MFKQSKILSALQYADKKRITTVAGAWVFFFLSALIPITFLLITAYGVLGVDVLMELVARLPEEFRQNATTVVETASKASNGVTLLFIFSVLFSSSALIRQMLKDGSRIYNVNVKHAGLLRIIKGIIAVCIMFLLFILSALLITFGHFLSSRASSNSGRRFLVVLSAILVTFICYFVIVMLNKFICPVRIDNPSIFSSSLISLAILFTGSVGLRIYVSVFSRFNAFYGSLAGVVGFLSWAYLCMLGLVIGVVCGEYFYKNKVFAKNRLS